MLVDFNKSFVIESNHFNRVYLRMDGSGITKNESAGGGSVNCRRGFGPSVQFKFHLCPDGTFTIESVQYPGVFLRMDGSGIKRMSDNGEGHINCQFGAYAWEHFKFHEQKDGTYTIESVAFPNVYLRIDGQAGIANCQFGASIYEHFRIIPAEVVKMAQK